MRKREAGVAIFAMICVSLGIGGILSKTSGQVGVAAAPALSVASSDLEFGDLSAGAAATQNLAVSNSGSADVEVASVVAGGGDFSVDSARSTCPIGGGTLPAGQTCAVAITFKPSGSGARTGILRIVSNASGSPHVTRLQGTNGPAAPSSAVSVDMSQVPESQSSASPAVSNVFVSRTAPRPAPFIPQDVPTNARVAPPALQSPSVTPLSAPLSDVSFSGGRGPVSVPAGGYCGNTQCTNGCYCWSMPEDASVAEGSGYVLAASNDRITIHDTNGTLVANKNETNFWKSIALGHPISDPTVGYSWENNQWFMAVEDFQLTDILYLAASKTGNPDGGWWFFSLTACPDSPFGDRPILGVGANYILLTAQCPESSTNTGGFYAIDHNNLFNGTLGNPPPPLQSIPNFNAPVTDSLKSDTFTQYLLLPNVDSQNNLSVFIATLTSAGSYDPTAVVNYPLGQGLGTVPFGNQGADAYGNPACQGCTGSRNDVTVQDEAFKIADTAFNGGFGYDTIYASLSVGLQVLGQQGGALVVAAIQPDAPAGQQSYSMLYAPNLITDTFTYGSIAGACPGNPGPTQGCCRGGQWLLGYDYLSSASLPSEAYITGTLTPSGLSLSSAASVFKASAGQAGALSLPGYTPGNQCVLNGPSNSNSACRWGDYSFTFWNIGNAGNWWTDEHYAYHWVPASGQYVDTWADWVAGVAVPTPPACQ
jgi:Abnormal spindle-like microcephaly-assoc'd, ASPM-SPD-2-Hydin